MWVRGRSDPRLDESLKLIWRQLFPATNSIPLLAQVLGQFFFHLARRLVGHRVEIFVQLGEQLHTVLTSVVRSLVPVLVVLKPLDRRNPRHPDVHAQLLRISLRIQRPDLALFRDRAVEQDDVDIMMKSVGHRQGAV